MRTQSTRTVSRTRTPRASRSMIASTPYWETTNAAIPAEAASAQAVSPNPPTASKHARARSAGPTKFAMLKTPMYQRGRERTVSGTKAMTIASAVSAGGRSSAAAKIGASERCDPLMLLALGADKVDRGDDRHEDGKGPPIVPGDLGGNGREGEAGQRQPDDGELEGRRSRIEP